MRIGKYSQKDIITWDVIVAVIDLLLIFGIFELCLNTFWFTDKLDLVLKRPRSIYFLVVGCVVASFVLPSRLLDREMNYTRILERSFSYCAVALSVLAFSVWVMFSSFAGRFFLEMAVISVSLIYIIHLLIRQFIRKRIRKGEKNRIVIIGDDSNAKSLFGTISDGKLYEDCCVVDFFDNPDYPWYGLDHQSQRQEIERYIKEQSIDEMYCSVDPAMEPEYVNSLIRICDDNYVTFYYVPDMSGYINRSLSYSKIGQSTVVKLLDEPLESPMNRFVKRSFDVVCSGLALAILFPVVFVFVSIGIKLTSPGPVFFCQKRTGYKGKSFNMIKFRSMKVNDQADTLQATKDDDRKTRFGEFIRRTSIDELPQLINIFKGDMSIVGPRPHMEAHTEFYSKVLDEYLIRHMVKPGLTGWAQVSGCRGETETPDKMADRVTHDIWYIEHWSFSLDIKIIIMTAIQFFMGDSNAY